MGERRFTLSEQEAPRSALDLAAFIQTEVYFGKAEIERLLCLCPVRKWHRVHLAAGRLYSDDVVGWGAIVFSCLVWTEWTGERLT